MEKTRSYDRQTLHFFWQACLQQKRQLSLAFLFPLGAITTTVAVPLIVGRIIASLSNPHADSYHYIPYLIGAGALGVLLNRFGAQALFTVQARVMGTLQEQAFQGLIRRSMGFHNNNIGGKLVSDAIDYPSAYAALMDALFTNLLPFVLILICGSAVVFVESWQLGLVVIAMSAYALGSTYWSTVRRSDVRRKRQLLAKTVTGHVADAIVNVATVKTFAKEDHEVQHHRNLNSTLTEVRTDDWRTGSGMANTRTAVLLVMQVIFILLLIRTVRHDPSVLDVGIFAFSFITTLSIRLIQLHPLMRQIEDGFLNASPMTEILSQQLEIKDAPGAKPLQVPKGRLTLANVSFHYDDADTRDNVFSRLTLDIQPGEKIGLVGPSGGGKSTLTRLLLRFEDIDSGQILIDGQNIATVTQESLRQAIAYVPQEPLLFHRSVAENIAYGKAEATLEEVQRAAKLAYAHDFIEELSQGYDTVVGERGVKLSGGQRQRIAIARAILKDAPILLLDEATSALDSESEVFIQKALLKLMKNRTTLVIAHRLSTVQSMDRIVVLEDGAITEQGSHQELRQRKGTYARLWAHQSGGFIED
jgi:ATP-binding cassette subfamily B protein